MEPIQLLSDEKIRAALREGEEAVIVIFHRTIGQLAARPQALEDRVSRNSHSRNSGKPPSGDGLNKPAPQSQRKRRGWESGGKTGHEGRMLKAVQHPEHFQVHALKQRQHCQASLEQVHPNGVEKRQVFDLPRLRVEATQHQAEIKSYPPFGTENKASFPDGVTQPVQYGSEVKSLTVYLNAYQMIP